MATPNTNPTTSSRGICACGRRFNRAVGYAACCACRGQYGGMCAEEPNPRSASIIEMYRSGATLREVSHAYSLSKERVRQIVSAYGVSKSEGGAGLIGKRNRQSKQSAMDARYLSKWGHFRAEHKKLLAIGRGDRASRNPIRAFIQQRKSADVRGIEWRLTLAEWWRIWSESGKWGVRGVGHGAYVMSRFGDDGAYEPGNVFIQTADLNNSTGPQKKCGLPTGVRYVKHKGKHTGKYCAMKMLNGRVRYLGTYQTVEDAVVAYQSAT
jgi:hypothetical protein